MEQLEIISGADLQWEDYSRIQEFVAVSFGNPVPPMPEKNPENLRWFRHKYRYYRYTEIDGKIASGLWAYPIPFLADGRNVDVWSIGGVSTAPEFRGRSLMSRMMTQVMRDIREAGAALIWLAGKKDRYMHFGFQRAGNMLELDIEADNVRRHLTAHGNKTVFYPAPAQVPWHEVQKLTCPQRYRHDVPLEDYAFKCIDHQYLAAFALENGIPAAAIVFKPSERPELAEYGGKTEPLEDLLLAFSQKYPSFQVRLPHMDSPFFRSFFPLAERWRIDINYNIAVTDLQKCLKLSETHFRTVHDCLEGRSVNFVMTGGIFLEQRASLAVRNRQLQVGQPLPCAPEIVLTPEDMAALIFGPVRPSVLTRSPETAWLDLLFPVVLNLQHSVHGA